MAAKQLEPDEAMKRLQEAGFTRWEFGSTAVPVKEGAFTVLRARRYMRGCRDETPRCTFYSWCDDISERAVGQAVAMTRLSF